MSEEKKSSAEIALFENILEFNTRLDLLNSFLEEIPDFIQKKTSELSEIDVQKFGIYSQVGRAEAISKFMFEFENTLLKSFIVTLVIFLETEIGIYCDELKNQLNTKETWNNLRGTTIERLVEYTTKKLGMKLSIPEELWKKIDYIITLRSCIISFSGRIENFSSAKKIENLSKIVKGMSIKDSSVILSKEFCEECVEIVRKFLENLYDDGLKAVNQFSVLNSI